VNELYRFLTFQLSPEWYRLTPDERATQKREFATALRDGEARTHAYSLVGTRTDADLLLWLVGEELEDLRRTEARLRATALWAWSTRPYGYLASRRKSKYLGEHAHAGSEHDRSVAGPVGDKPYLVVYPMTKQRRWYALPVEERTRIMAGHFAVGHRYPDVRIHTAYSFGLDDRTDVGLDMEGHAHAFERQHDVGIEDGPIDAEPAHRDRADLGAQLRRARDLEDAVTFAERAVLREGAARLAHEPHRGALDGLAPAGADEQRRASAGDPLALVGHRRIGSRTAAPSISSRASASDRAVPVKIGVSVAV